jgi:hypothetical protein
MDKKWDMLVCCCKSSIFLTLFEAFFQKSNFLQNPENDYTSRLCHHCFSIDNDRTGGRDIYQISIEFE